jgi:hypothetical protein
MSSFQPSLGFLDKCEGGELVRMRVGDSSTWAITCARQSAFAHSILILGGSKGARTRNLRREGRIGDLDVPVLRYGKKFGVEVDHTGPVNIVVGDTAKIPGRILQANNDFYMVAEMEEGGLEYVLLGNGTVHSEPGGHRALYSQWALVHNEITKNGYPLVLMEFDASKDTRSEKDAVRAPALSPAQ